jgi:hypothetical protein
MRRLRSLFATGAAVAATTALAVTSLLAAPSAAAAPAADPPPPGWVAEWGPIVHGTASSSGVSWSEDNPDSSYDDLFVEGELTNTGRGCYSLWVVWTDDFVVQYPKKYATQCGPGTAPVNIDWHWNYTSGSRAFICRGTENTTDCGAERGLYWWPASTTTD